METKKNTGRFIIDDAIAAFWKLFKRRKLSKDDIRNFRLMIVACVLNLSFALEKLFIICGCPLSDWVWFIIYGGFGLWIAWLAIQDYMLDVYDGTDNDKTNKLL